MDMERWTESERANTRLWGLQRRLSRAPEHKKQSAVSHLRDEPVRGKDRSDVVAEGIVQRRRLDWLSR